MEETGIHNIVYSKNTVEFVTVAAEYVILAENTRGMERVDFTNKTQKLLPLLYLKASLIPEIEVQLEDNIEKFVSEEEWSLVQQGFSSVLGRFDRFLDIENSIGQVEDETAEEALSECLADIYQDLSDFVQLYRMGNLEIMNDALWECRQNFEQYWGTRLIEAFRAIHAMLYGSEDISVEDEESRPVFDPENERDKSNWLHPKQIRDIKK